jgi:hypothetical protein
MDCPVGTCSPNHACVPLPDGCLTVETLDLSKGPVHLTGSLSKAADDTRLSCATSTQGNDLVYTFTTASSGRLVATATTDGSFRPALELRSSCTGAQNPLGCNKAGASNNNSVTLQIDPLPNGTYWLWLDSDDGSAGDFTLDVTLENPQLADSCSAPDLIELKDSPVVLTGSTVGLKDDGAGTCGGQGGPDAVFAMHTGGPKSIRVELTTTTPGYAPVFYLRQRCDSADPADQVACVASGPNQAFTVPLFGPGVLYLFIDGQAGNQFVTAGDFTLTVTPMDAAQPPQNDTCGFAQTLALPAIGSGSVSVQSDTTAALDNSDGCGGAGSPDLVYRFHLDQPRLVQTTVTPLSGANYLPLVYLRPGNACSSEAANDQVACTYAFNWGQPVTSVVPSLPAGDWFLWVDGFLYTSGPFNLQVDTADPPPPPPNDTCSMPGMLNVTSGYGTVTGTTLGATQDVVDSRCTAPPGVSSPDVVYGISLAQPSFIGLDLKASQSSALQPVVELRGGPNVLTCTDSLLGSSLLGCNWGDYAVPNRTVFTAPSVDPGEYYVWVEGDYGSQGDFSLRVVTEAPPPPAPNDTCQSLSAPLSLGMTVSGDTRNAQADAMDPLLGGDFGRDVVYTVVVGSNSTLTVTVTPDPTEGTLLRPALALRATCNDPNTTVDAVEANDYGVPFSHTFTQLPANTYYLWVGGVRQSSGAFTLQLQ